MTFLNDNVTIQKIHAGLHLTNGKTYNCVS
jgi:hypothetical protein